MLAAELAYSLMRTGTSFSFYELDPQEGGPFSTREEDQAEIAIIDTPGFLGEDIAEQLAQADVVIIPTRASMTDMIPLQRMLDLTRRYAAGKPVIVVVNEWNRYTANKDYTDWLKNEIEGEDIQLQYVPHTEAVPRAGMEDTAVFTYAKKHGQKHAAVRLLDTVNAMREAADLAPEVWEEA